MSITYSAMSLFESNEYDSSLFIEPRHREICDLQLARIKSNAIELGGGGCQHEHGRVNITKEQSFSTVSSLCDEVKK